MSIIKSIDVANIQGNVTTQTIKHGVIVKENTTHNKITSDGITNLLYSLTRNFTSYLTGIQIDYYETSGSASSVSTTETRYFSQVHIVAGQHPYAEFKFYLGTNGADVDDINGCTICGAHLMTTDNVGHEVEFASVTTADTYEDIEEGQTVDVPVFAPIEKTADVAVMFIWRIGISSIFTKIIS